jgi:hypothetical protein
MPGGGELLGNKEGGTLGRPRQPEDLGAGLGRYCQWRTVGPQRGRALVATLRRVTGTSLHLGGVAS